MNEINDLNKPALTRIPQLLQRQLAMRPDETAIIDFDDRVFTYAEWAAAVDFAEQVLRDAGILPGHRVMLVAENCVAFTAYVLAAWRCEAWVVPLNARMSKGEISRITDHAKPKIIVYTTNASLPAQDHFARISDTFQCLEPGSNPCGQVALAITEHDQPEPVAGDLIAALMYTTGTTGNPKGVMLSHANLLFSSAQSRQVRALGPDDRLLCVLPMTHIFGFSSAFLGALNGGTEIRLTNRFDPAMVFDEIRAGITLMPAVPAMYSHLLNFAAKTGISELKNTKLRYISAGGAPLDADWKRRVEAFFGLTLHNGYGMTEASPGIAATSVGNERSDTSCGFPMENVEVKIVAATNGGETGEGVGEIVVRGPNIMAGYYRNEAETAKVMDADGFFHTGDLGRFDGDGCLHIVGRSKELIIRSGFNVYPLEVEAALNKHPAITQSAVVGRVLDGGNEEVLAFVQKVPGQAVEEEEIKAFLSQDLVAYKRPSQIIIADELPASSTGKLLKHKMITTFADQLEG